MRVMFVIFAIVLLYAIFKNKNAISHSWIVDTPIAHRGYHNNIDVPENTMRAFQEAIKQKFAVELDVQLTQDKELVVFHDKNLLRLCNVDLLLSRVNFRELQKYKILNSNENIPKLSKVLELIDDQIPIVIEIKQNGKVGELEDKLVSELRKYNGRYAIVSFNSLSLRYLKQYSLCCIGQNYDPDDYNTNNVFASLFYLLKNLFYSRPDFIVFNYKSLSQKIVKIVNKYFTMIAYNLKRSESRLSSADNVIFDL